MDAQKTRSTEPAALLVPLMVLLLAAAVRIVGMGHFPVWTDEGWTAWATEHLSQVFTNIAEDRHPPLYFFGLALWQDVAGMSRVALRLPSVWSGLLVVALTWRIGRRVLGARAALYAALLVAVIPATVYYTTEIRHFGWLTLMLCLSSWAFLRVLHRPSVLRYTLYAVSVAAIMYTLYIGFFVILVQVLVALLIWRGSLRHKAMFVGAWTLALGLFAPWLYVVLRYQLGLMSVGIAGVGNVSRTDLGALWSLLRDVLGNGLPLLILAWGVALAAVIRRRGVRAELAYVLLWGLGAFMLMAAVNPWMTMFRTRTVMPLTPGFVLAAAMGLALLPRRVQPVLVSLLLVGTIWRVLPVQPRMDHFTIASALAAEYQPGDYIVLETGWADDEFIYEIRHAVGWDADTQRTLHWVDYRGPNELVVLQIEDKLRASERIWVIHWNQPTQVASWLAGDEQDYTLAHESYHPVGRELEVYAGGYFARVDGDVRLYRFEKDTPSGE